MIRWGDIGVCASCRWWREVRATGRMRQGVCRREGAPTLQDQTCPEWHKREAKYEEPTA